MDAESFSSSDTPLEPKTATSSSDQSSLKACQEELGMWKERCLRISADFDNYKKRTEKEKMGWIKTSQSNLLYDLLMIVDDFDRALQEAHKQEPAEEFSIWLQGFELTDKALRKLLEKYEVQEIKDHDVFNPHYHEAIMHIDSPDHISGSIVSVLQKGYLFKGDVLRPAKVSVAK